MRSRIASYADFTTCSPALYTLGPLLQLTAYMDAVVPRPFRRALAERVPHKGFKKLLSIVDTVHESSTRIVAQKRAAIESGGDAVKELLNEGKDLMSILRKSSSF